MSKKSRRRNKKILAALALAGGAAMFGRRKKNALGDTGTLSGKTGSEGMDYLAPTKKPIVLKQDKKLNVLKQNKPKLFGKNTSANPDAIPHDEIFNARHGIGITKDPGWVDAKTGSRDDLMKFMTQKDNQNYAIRQKALKRARGTDYSVSGLKRGGRITLKSGGRVGVGKAKRGFSKLLRKK